MKDSVQIVRMSFSKFDFFKIMFIKRYYLSLNDTTEYKKINKYKHEFYLKRKKKKNDLKKSL